MSVERYWLSLYGFDSDTPAPRSESLRRCYWMLSRLYGVELGLLGAAEAGECDDCHRTGHRFRVGRVDVCRRCAFRRGAAIRRAA